MPSHNFKKIYTRPTRAQDCEVYIRPALKFSGNKITEVIFLPRDGKWEAWYREDEFLKFMQELAKKMRSKSWSIDKHLKEYKVCAQEFRGAARDLARVSKNKTLKELVPYYKEYYTKKWYKIAPFIWLPWAISYVLDDWFTKALKEKYDNWQEIYDSLAVSSRPIQMQQLIEKILEWKIKKASKKELGRLVKKYGHLGAYSVNGAYWTANDILNQVKQFKNLKKDLEKMKNERRVARIKAQKTLRQLKGDPLFYQVAKTIHEYMFLRTERADLYKEALLIIAPFYRRLEKDLHLPWGWAANLSYQEIIDALEKKKLPRMKDLSDRARYQYVMYFSKKGIKIISDPKEQLKFLKSKIKGFGKKSKAKSVSGKTAHPGEVKGRARVIIHVKDMSKMKKGEILISNMTHPDYMSAIYKAKAIVTDEGGIVCHAAIISRELKIPCVIGTGEATKIFKTGDMVEVDAERGIVQILK